MIDHEEIYRSRAEDYDLLVSREDFQGRILTALSNIRALEGLDAAELGAGSGRLTALIARPARSVQAFDRSVHMLDYAAGKLQRLGISNNVSFQVADNRLLPLSNRCVDIAVSGWSIGYFAAPANSDWRRDVDRTLAEMTRIL